MTRSRTRSTAASSRSSDTSSAAPRAGAGASEDAAKAAERLEPAAALSDLAPCELVIEAAPERLELKRELFAKLSAEVVSEQCVLASNTSSLLVTAIAGAARHPERVVGMHFFNPAAVDGAARGCRRRAVRRTGARGRARRRRGDGQARDRGGRWARVHRQPLQSPVRARGAEAAPGASRDVRSDRPRVPARRRLPDGAVRADGPRRRRRRPRRGEVFLRAELRRAALATLADHRQDGGSGPPRP